ncbi:MAG TPA: hypothetical protein VGZ47_08155 [Gemmataceae bacterium]|nr:hypothetical protein [Gemmataceae bacterium]
MRVPLWFKLAYHIWLLGWLIAAGKSYPYPHLLWLCYLGNIVVGIALWTENRLLFSWQCNSLFFIDVLWTFDVVTRAISEWSALLFGQKLFPYNSPLGTGYMFSPQVDNFLKFMSLFHILMPFLFFWGMYRFGYDRRALWPQLLTVAIVYPLTYWVSLHFGDVHDNIRDDINWVFGPFAKPPEDFVPHVRTLIFALIVYPIFMYIPANFLLTAMFRQPAARDAKARG